MTIEERFARIGHVTAGMAEQREKDREEYKALWRNTLRQIDALATTTRERIDQIADSIAQMAEENRRTVEENRAEHKRLRQSDAELNARVGALVSAIGQSIASQQPRQ